MNSYEKDAARYRAIRKAATENDMDFLDRLDETVSKFVDPEHPTPEEFDKSIDAAMNETETV